MAPLCQPSPNQIHIQKHDIAFNVYHCLIMSPDSQEPPSLPISMSCCCSMERVAGRLLDLFTMGPPIIPLGLCPMPGCPAGPMGLALDLDMPQSPGPIMLGGCWGIPMPLFMPPKRDTERRSQGQHSVLCTNNNTIGSD